jgi:hypothetical protein
MTRPLRVPHLEDSPRDAEIAVHLAFEEASRTGVFSLECRIRWPDTSLHWINAQGRVDRDARGVPVRAVRALRDRFEAFERIDFFSTVARDETAVASPIWNGRSPARSRLEARPGRGDSRRSHSRASGTSRRAFSPNPPLTSSFQDSMSRLPNCARLCCSISRRW